MPPEQPIVHDSAAAYPAAQAQDTLAYEPVAEEQDWLEENDELPPRPRRRLLRVGGDIRQLILLAVLLIACGFIAGALVEKGQTSSSSAAAGSGSLASRFAALRGGGASAAGARSGASGGGGAASSFGGAGAGGRTAGQVAYLAGSTLYVTNAEGNTVKVKTSAGTTVTKSASSTVKKIHPGETVTVTGTSTNGVVSAEAISVGSTGGGLAALFGASGGSSAAKSSGSESTSSGPALFGSGG